MGGIRRTDNLVAGSVKELSGSDREGDNKAVAEHDASRLEDLGL